MKQTLLALAFVLGIQSAFGAYNGPLLNYHFQNGLVPAEDRMTVSCAVYSDKLVVNRRFNNASSTETTALELDQVGLKNAVESAANGKVDVIPGPGDGPTASFTATKILPNDKTEEVVLGKNGFDGVFNHSVGAMNLISLIKSTCRL